MVKQLPLRVLLALVLTLANARGDIPVERVPARVLRIVDGDTLEARMGEETQRIRLAEIERAGFHYLISLRISPDMRGEEAKLPSRTPFSALPSPEKFEALSMPVPIRWPVSP